MGRRLADLWPFGQVGSEEEDMNSIAQMSPSEYMNDLLQLDVPDYGTVSLSSYLSANAMFGGNSKAGKVATAMQQIVRGKPEFQLTQADGFSRVFTGQGSEDNTVNALSIVNIYQDQFKKVAGLEKYFQQDDFLQAMIKDACFGLDLHGFYRDYWSKRVWKRGMWGGGRWITHICFGR